MDKRSITHHISSHFNEELTRVFDDVLKMAEMVAMQIESAMQALLEGDTETAIQVDAADDQINAMELRIDDECTEIIARRQPAAGDLRFVMAMIKTITDLERMGDEASRIGRMAAALAPSEDPQRRFSELAHMGQAVLQMTRDATTALRSMDVDLARKVWRQDANVDREYEALMRQLATHMMEDPKSIPRVLNVMWATRSLERIGDRARNICEYVIYLVEGVDVRHSNIGGFEPKAKS